VSRTLIDTSVFIEAERRNLQALERLALALDGGGVAMSAVTLAELLASDGLPPAQRRFYEDLITGEVVVLPATAFAALAGVEAARASGGGSAADILIAGAAIEHGLKLVTYDADLARMLGPSAELLRAS
jgi:predicted nucleic acid-binding protein